MKVNETYSIERDKHNFIVVEKILNNGVVKDGVSIPPKNKYRESKKYYPTLDKACIALVRQQIAIDTLESIRESVRMSTREILSAIKQEESE